MAAKHPATLDHTVVPAGISGDFCLHEIIEAQVARTPDAEAIAFESSTLSYRELNRRANQLAMRLAVAMPWLIAYVFARWAGKTATMP